MISKEKMLEYMAVIHSWVPMDRKNHEQYEAIRNLIEQYGPGEAVGMKSPSPQEESDTDGGALRRGNPLAGSMEAPSPSPGPSPEDREAVERLDGDVNELYGNLGRNHPTLATSEYSESRKALAHIRRRLGMEDGK